MVPCVLWTRPNSSASSLPVSHRLLSVSLSWPAFCSSDPVHHVLSCPGPLYLLFPLPGLLLLPITWWTPSPISVSVSLSQMSPCLTALSENAPLPTAAQPLHPPRWLTFFLAHPSLKWPYLFPCSLFASLTRTNAPQQQGPALSFHHCFLSAKNYVWHFVGTR